MSETEFFDYKQELLKRSLIGALNTTDKQKFLSGNMTDKEMEDLCKKEIPFEILHGAIPYHLFHSHEMSPDNGETMVGYLRLKNIETCLIDVIDNNIEGDFIETGVWKGGACICAKKTIDRKKSNKKVFVADSFCGVPPPDLNRYQQDRGDDHHTIDSLRISCEKVKQNFKNYNCLDENVVFLEGIFRDTLPTIKETQKFSVIRLDGDMYSSTMDALDNLYFKLSNGGYVIVDDGKVPRCVSAIQDFRKKHNITNNIIPIDAGGGFYWKKEI